MISFINSLGILYTISWSISYYFQIWTNFKLKSGFGYSLDYQLLNIYGYFCLFLTYYSEYKSKNNMEINIIDLIFSFHCFIISIIILIQTYYYPLKGNKFNFKAKFCLWICTLLSLIYYLLTLFLKKQKNIFKFLGTNKLILTFFRYSSQIYYNYKRKTTKGWNMMITYCDIIGSIFNLIQLFIIWYKSNICNLYNILFSVKFILAIITIVLEIIIILQKFIFYKSKNIILIKFID